MGVLYLLACVLVACVESSSGPAQLSQRVLAWPRHRSSCDSRLSALFGKLLQIKAHHSFIKHVRLHLITGSTPEG